MRGGDTNLFCLDITKKVSAKLLSGVISNIIILKNYFHS